MIMNAKCVMIKQISCIIAWQWALIGLINICHGICSAAVHAYFEFDILLTRILD